MDGDHDDFDDVLGIPLLERERQYLYEGLKKNILSSILLFFNLKVLSGLSSTCVT